MITTPREEVYAAISRERDNQDSKWGVEQPQSFMGLIAVIEAELNEVKLGWLKNMPGKSAPLNELVQVAATAVAALEKYGLEGCPASTDDIPPRFNVQFVTGWMSEQYAKKEQEKNDDQRNEARRPEGTTEPREATSSGDVGVPGLDWGLYFGSGDQIEPVLLRSHQDE